MSSASGVPNPQAANGNDSRFQDQLINFCKGKQMRPPTFQIHSDRRGGRTAWACSITVQGSQYQSRFWYDGQYVNHAREDAAQVALQKLGQPVTAEAAQSTNAQQKETPATTTAGAQQQRNYGVIGS